MSRDFDHYVTAAPTRPAIITADGTVIDYAEAGQRADLVSRLLEACSVREGDVVCTLLPNGADLITIQRGVLRMPVYLSIVNWHLTAREVAYILEDSGAALIFTTVELEPTLREAVAAAGLDPSIVVLVDAPLDDPRSMIARTSTLPAGRPESTGAGQRRMYTSGTTGKPKAVQRSLSGRSAADASRFWVKRAETYGLDEEAGVYLSVAPLYHAGPSSYVEQALDLGQTIVLLPRWDAAAAVAAIRRFEVTWVYLVPLMMQDLLRLPAAERVVPSLRRVFHTAAPCPPTVKRAMIEWLGPVLTELYGGTEGSCSIITSPEWLAHPGSVGRALGNVRIEIRDDDGRVLPAGEIGRIYFENGTLAFVYSNDAEKTAATRIGNAVTLGDIGYLDEDGYLYLCDREADVVISGGVNIYPAEVEHAIVEVDGVLDACIIGVPDERWGESLHAVVVLDETRSGLESDSTADALMAELRTRIAGFKVPRSFEFVDHLPYSESGKLLRRQIRSERLVGASASASETSR